MPLEENEIALIVSDIDYVIGNASVDEDDPFNQAAVRVAEFCKSLLQENKGLQETINFLPGLG